MYVLEQSGHRLVTYHMMQLRVNEPYLTSKTIASTLSCWKSVSSTKLCTMRLLHTFGHAYMITWCFAFSMFAKRSAFSAHWCSSWACSVAWYLGNAVVSCEAWHGLANMSMAAEVLAIESSGGGDMEGEEEGKMACCSPLLDVNIADVATLCPFAWYLPESKQCYRHMQCIHWG